jgi:uroporphyrinogen-III decarboxylase
MFKDPDIGKSAQQLRKERYKRIHAARTLRIPDRVPVSIPIGYFPAKFAGIPFSAAFDDFDGWYRAYEKALQEFRPDSFGGSNYQPGKALAMLELKTMKWPGFGVDPFHGHQSIEVDGLKADEFEQYMRGSDDYLLRIQMPRLSDRLKGLGKIPPLYGLLHGPNAPQAMAMAFSDPEVAAVITLLQKTGREMRKAKAKQAKFQRLLEKFGYYSTPMVGALPPFDIISHSLRGMTGTIYDMFRQPDKLVELCEFVLKEELARTPLVPDENGEIRIFMTNTRGSDEFLSQKQFDTFYWPTFKKLVVNLCKRGATPNIFFEGNFDSRIKYLLEFPKGKFVAKFDTSDIFRAKEILKGHCCIEGNVPSSLLQAGTKEDVISYSKKLIDVVGKDGGFILSPRSSTDEVKPENLKAMIDFTKEYGVYR